MKRSSFKRRQKGAAAVELAILMPLLIVFLTLPIFFAHLCWQYTIAQKAAQDAVRYLSTVPVSEMLTRASAEAAGELAKEIVRREIAEVSPDAEIGSIEISCDDWNCGGKLSGDLPKTVRVKFSITVFDPSGVLDIGWYGLPITADYTMQYDGN